MRGNRYCDHLQHHHSERRRRCGSPRRELDRKWGIGRLRLLVDDALRARFDQQRRLFNAALVNGDEEQVALHGAAMRRGWDALDAAATEAVHSRYILSMGMYLAR